MCSHTAAQLAPTMTILFLKKTISSPINFVSLSKCNHNHKIENYTSQRISFLFSIILMGQKEMRLDQAKISLVGHHDNPLSEDNFEPSCIKSLV